MQPIATIPAQTRRQAMDWSLVLASQGIEPVIERAEIGYQLIVPADSYDAAVDAIRKYRAENRSWPWRQVVLRQGLIFDWASLAWVAMIVAFHWASSQVDLVSSGMMDSTAVAHGQWWRPLTAVWLHADIGHLATNAALGFLLLGLVIGRFGMGGGMLGAYMAGVGGNLLSWAGAGQPHRSLGASGLVMGCVGMLAVQSIVQWRRSPHGRRAIVAGLAAGVLLFVLLGLSPGSDVLAHFGGFVSGLFIGASFVAIGSGLQKTTSNVLAAAVFVLLVIVPWCFALSRS